LIRFLGSRGASAVVAAILLALGGSSGALAQVQQTLPVVQQAIAAQVPAIGTVPITTPTPPIRTVSLSELVDANSAGDPLDEEQGCLATAVYFESQGEPLEGQLAVAQVVLNRAASGQYPASLCGVVKQKAQFSFVHGGRFPRVNTACDGWRKAQAIARIASKKLVSTVPTSVLWYHANYVAPSWRLNLKKVDKIGAHIFYRA
jgi:spore germination cell wall hydrolase CwlJ-like protein